MPGYFHGPADAVTHIVGSAELRRRAGNGNASFIVTANELSSRAQKGNYSAASDMDDASNAIGLAIGETARSYEEVVARARDAIARGIESGGSGANGTPVWLAPAEWGGDRGRTGIIRDRIVWEPRPAGGGTYAQGGPEHAYHYNTPRWREAERLRDLGATPVESWSDDEVRAVIRSRPYQDRHDPDHAIWQERVRAHFEAKLRREQEGAGEPRSRSDHGGSGTVQVVAHIRDGHPVVAHQRSAPN